MIRRAKKRKKPARIMSNTFTTVMISMKRFFFTLCAVSLATALNFSVAAAVEAPKDLVKTTVDQVRATVAADKGKLSPEQLDDKLKEIIAPVFDFREMSQRCLGANWKTASEDERKEFVDLFSKLLAKNYLKKIRDNASESELTISGQEDVGEGKILVKTVVAYSGDKVTIDYRMRQKEGVWRIYDVVVENIGLVSNYRSEFSGIIKNEKMAGLLKRLREKK